MRLTTYFTLEDIDKLAMPQSKMRIDRTGEYDISFYENYLKENIEAMEDLITVIQTNIPLINDEHDHKSILWELERNIYRIYYKYKQKNPQFDYESHIEKHGIEGVGYIEEHKYSKFIQSEMNAALKDYSEIVGFMNLVYCLYKRAYKKKNFDAEALWHIFDGAKKTCEQLGIRSVDDSAFCDVIMAGPFSGYDEDEENFDSLHIDDYEIYDDNPYNADITFTSLPYYIVVPDFTAHGPRNMRTFLHEPKSKIIYNKAYIDQLPHHTI